MELKRVYGDHQLGYIDEATLTEPSDFRGNLIKEYELSLKEFFPVYLNILRFSGLYIDSSKYDEALGWPEDGIEPGTRWDDVPDDWLCPECGVGKEDFDMIEI